MTNITVSAAIDAFMQAESATAARAALGVTIGEHVQAFSSALASLGEATPGSNHFLVGDGSIWENKTAAEARGALGLGTIATLNAPTGDVVGTTDAQTLTNKTVPFANNTLTGVMSTGTAQQFTRQKAFTLATLTDGANIAWNLNENQVAEVTLEGNRTLDNPTNMIAGGTYLLIVKQDATGGRELSYGSDFKWSGGSAPDLSAGANAVDILSFVSDGTSMFGSIVHNFS